jgi:hypothetical protein
MSEMVERARLAFLEELRKTPAWLYIHNCEVADFRRAMRTAIAEMREPTEGMIAAGGNCGGFEFDGESGTIYPSPIWRAMIDAALKE